MARINVHYLIYFIQLSMLSGYYSRRAHCAHYVVNGLQKQEHTLMTHISGNYGSNLIDNCQSIPNDSLYSCSPQTPHNTSCYPKGLIKVCPKLNKTTAILGPMPA